MGYDKKDKLKSTSFWCNEFSVGSGPLRKIGNAIVVLWETENVNYYYC